MSLDLDAIKAKYLRLCGICDAGIGMACTCPSDDDYRNTLQALIAEVERLRAQLDKPCGSCHPCTNWPAETWRQAGRHLPDVHKFGEMEDELKRLRDALDGAS